MKQSKAPDILSTSIVAKTNIFEVQAVNLRFSNGVERTYERLTPQRGSSVMVIPIHNNEVIFIKEYAVGSERYELTFPKGMVDKDEMPIMSANRELQEEIGFAARQLTFIRSLYSAPSHMFGLMHLFIAENLYPSKLEGDEPEPLEMVRYPLDQIDVLLNDIQFSESRNLAALFLLKEYLKG